jgi:hypothetical protein
VIASRMERISAPVLPWRSIEMRTCLDIVWISWGEKCGCF